MQAIFRAIALGQAFFDVFPQLSPTQVGETLSFSKKNPWVFPKIPNFYSKEIFPKFPEISQF